jgi:hypothetical protein
MNELERMQYLVKLVDYNPETGSMIWKRRERSDSGTNIFNSRFAGKECGALANKYMRIQFWIDRQLFRIKVHRLAWFIVNGVVPTGEIDHINGIPSDNRIVNLRDVSKSVNSRNKTRQTNNKSGVTGVSWCNSRNKWLSRSKIEGKNYHLGYFDDIKDAERAVLEFRTHHDFTERHGM